MLELKGRWALVTGASRGIGQQTALALAEYGCNLVLHSRKKIHTEKLELQLKQKNVMALSVEADLEDMRQIDRMFAEIEEKGIRIDIVYNIAAVINNVLDFFSISETDYTKMFQINVVAVAKICNYYIPRMLERNFGRIINVVSFINNEPKAMVYGASKAALIKLTSEMAYAVNGTNVMINMAEPGWLRTGMGTENAPNPVEKCRAGMLLGAVANDGISGRIFCVPPYYECSLEEAYERESRKPAAYMPDFLQENACILPKVTSISDFKHKYQEFMQSSKKKIVFGGGNQAKFFIDIFRYLQCEIDAVMCTCRPEGVQSIRNIPLYSLDELPYSQEECVVVIALTEKYVSGARNQLSDMGYRVLESYSVLYTERNWCSEDGERISDIYQYRADTFTGKGMDES